MVLQAMSLDHEKEGRQLGRYRLDRLISVFESMEVFDATQAGPFGFSRPVRIKRMLPSRPRSSRCRHRFAGAAKAAAGLSHPNLVSTLDCIETPDLAVVVERIGGLSLGELLARLHACGQGVPQNVVSHIASQILHGLGYAHGRSVAHGALTPDEVLLSIKGEVKIDGFGFSAPGNPSDTQADLYDAGLILCELLSARDMAGDSLPAAIVERMLDPEPKKRFPSAGDALAGWAVPAASPLELGDLVQRLMDGPDEEATVVGIRCASKATREDDVPWGFAPMVSRAAKAEALNPSTPTRAERLKVVTIEPYQRGSHRRPERLSTECATTETSEFSVDMAVQKLLAQAEVSDEAPPKAIAKGDHETGIPTEELTATGIARAYKEKRAKRPPFWMLCALATGLAFFLSATCVFVLSALVFDAPKPAPPPDQPQALPDPPVVAPLPGSPTLAPSPSQEPLSRRTKGTIFLPASRLGTGELLVPPVEDEPGALDRRLDTTVR